MLSTYEKRFDELERRMDHVERRLGLRPPPLPPLPVPAERSDGEVVHDAGDLLRQRHPLTPPVILPPGSVLSDDEEVQLDDAAEAMRIDYEPAETPPPPPRQSSIEQTLGLKWAGWVGAIVLVIGAGLGIKYAYDQGWFAAIPDTLKLVFMSMAGFALIGAGEWVYRRINRLSAAGLFGAGVALLFIVSYAGHGFYQLYARNTAFALMGLSTLVGAAVAIRGNLVSIAVLSLIGGNLAPVLLSTGNPSLPAFFAYLIALQVVALVLAAWGNSSKWWMLRGLSLAGTVVWGMGTLVNFPGTSHAIADVVFFTLSAALYQVELIVSTYRARDGRRADNGVAFSTLVTAALTAGTLIALNASPDLVRGAWVLGMGAFAGAAGFLLRDGQGTSVRALKIAYRVHAAALLALAVPVMLSGVSIEIGWGVLAVTFALLAVILGSNISRAGAVLCWALAVGHLGLRVSDPLTMSSARAVWFTIAGAAVPAYVMVGCSLALIGQAVASMIRRTRSTGEAGERSACHPWIVPMSRAVSIVAGLVWGIATISGLPTLGATVALLAYAWVLVGIDLVDTSLGATEQAVATLGAAMMKWVFVDLLADRLSGQWTPSAYLAVLTPAMAVGTAIAVSMVGLFFLRRRSLISAMERWVGSETAQRDAGLLLLGAVALLMTIGLTFEIDRVVELRAAHLVWPMGQLKQLLWTMLWGTVGAGMLILARRVEPSPQRRRGWARGIAPFPALIAAKFIICDTWWHAIGGTPAAVLPLANVQTLAAIVVIAVMAAYRSLHGASPEAGVASKVYRLAGALVVAVLLIVGWTEIGRVFSYLVASGAMAFSDAGLAKSVAISVFDALFAVAAVILGFRFHSTGLRYFGLGLFGLTLVKIFLIDLAHAGQGYRILSFIALGLLLLGTSVLYGKLSPKLLGEEA